MTDPTRRAADQGVVAVTARTMQRTGSGLWDWAERRKIAAHICIAITLWLTVRVVEWSMDFADLNVTRESNSVGVIIGAVLTPWGLMQGAMFKFYMELIKSNGDRT